MQSSAGLHIPLDVRAQIEPGFGNGEPLLYLQASARLRLSEPFRIEGPDGPEPARDIVVLYIDLTLVPGEPPETPELHGR